MHVTLNMGISDEIDVATIPFNQTTILEMKARVAELPRAPPLDPPLKYNLGPSYIR